MQRQENKSRIGEEIERMPYEPLLPIEKKLVAGSLILGAVLLVLLLWWTRG